MAKYTQGPWVAENSSVIGPDNKIICSCIRGSIDRGSHDEDYATARLIAAAPELLEVARMAGLFAKGEALPTREQLVEFSRAAIAKATGADA